MQLHRRALTLIAVLALLLSACASSPEVSVAEDVSTTTTTTVAARTSDEAATTVDNGSAVDVLDELPDEDDSPSEEESIAAGIRSQRDDVALRVVQADPASAGGASTLIVEIFGVKNNGSGDGIPRGDGFVEGPKLTVATASAVSFTDLPDFCVRSEGQIECASDTTLFGSSLTETPALTLEFGYLVPAEAGFPIIFELTGTSFENPVSNDPDPTNNVLTVEVQQAG